MRCYRYLNYKYGIRSILESAFKVASPDEFNDPFDCLGNVYGTPSRQSLRNFAATLKRAPSVTIEQTIDWLQRDFDLKFAASIHDRKRIGELYRILCFSNVDIADANSETLMWAHYADKGSGVRVLLELSADELPSGCVIESVEYAPDGCVPLLSLATISDFPMCPEIANFYAKCITTKGKSWDYEKEVRLVVGPDALKNLLRVESCGKKVELLQLPRSVIKGVDFGYKVSERRVRAAIEKLNATGCRLTYRWAKFSGEKYEYDYWRWNPNGRWMAES